MSVLYIVLPLALVLAIGAVAAFIWAVRTGQMDDLKTPALRVLHDDVDAKPLDASKPTARTRRRGDAMATTQADTPLARSRASIADGDSKPPLAPGTQKAD